MWVSVSAVDEALAQQVPELTALDRLRVCADPSSLPFSNRDRAGFENKIADIVADELKLPLRYYWVPQGPGFVRNTLGSGLCDVIIGYASGADIVQHTNPYYTSTYVLVTKRGSPIDGVERLEDPRLKDAKLGVIAATPAADHLLRLGLTAGAKTYSLLVDRRYDSPAEEALADVQQRSHRRPPSYGDRSAVTSRVGQGAQPSACRPCTKTSARRSRSGSPSASGPMNRTGNID